MCTYGGDEEAKAEEWERESGKGGSADAHHDKDNDDGDDSGDGDDGDDDDDDGADGDAGDDVCDDGVGGQSQSRNLFRNMQYLLPRFSKRHHFGARFGKQGYHCVAF